MSFGYRESGKIGRMNPPPRNTHVLPELRNGWTGAIAFPPKRVRLLFLFVGRDRHSPPPAIPPDQVSQSGGIKITGIMKQRVHFMALAATVLLPLLIFCSAMVFLFDRQQQEQVERM